MTIFDLIFAAVFVATVITLVAAAAAAARGRKGRAVGLLGGVGIFVAFYLAIVVATSLATPQRVIELKELRCSDDWCISVDRVDRTPEGADTLCAVTLRLHSRARGRAQRENGVSVYVLDDRGRRYEPREDPQDVPFNVRLEAGESVTALRRFLLPADARDTELVVARGRLPGMFIVGDDQSLLHKPSVIRLP